MLSSSNSLSKLLQSELSKGQSNESFGQYQKQARCLFYGRGGCFPGLEHVVVECFFPFIVCKVYRQSTSLFSDAHFDDLCRLISQQGFEAFWLQHCYREATSGPQMESKWEILWKSNDQDDLSLGVDVNVIEQGLHYRVVLGKNRNTGIFLDMARGREWVIDNSKEANVLNLFAYTCAFSVAAMAGEAKQIINVDMSKGALRWGKINHRLNGWDESQRPFVKFLNYNLLKNWGKLKKLGPFDLIIIDPPAFQKGSFNVEQDYIKVIRKAVSVLSPAGKMLICLNSPYLDFAFIERLFSELDTKWLCSERLSAGPDFPDVYPEKGLKLGVFQRV